MKYNLCYFLFIILTVVCILRCALAAWTIDDPPKTPDKKTILTCSEWIIYHGFLPGNTIENQRKAFGRAASLDGEAFALAVGYAHLLSCYNGSDDIISPIKFCASRGIRKTRVKFVPLYRELKSCKDWIFLYGYEFNDNSKNWKMARSRNFLTDGDVCHWVVGYSQILSSLTEQNAISPQEFCTGIGIINAHSPLPFLTRNETRLSCDNWIKLYGFTDDDNKNFELTQREYNQLFSNQIHYLVKSYAAHIFRIGQPSTIKPWQYCISIGLNLVDGLPFYTYQAVV